MLLRHLFLYLAHGRHKQNTIYASKSKTAARFGRTRSYPAKYYTVFFKYFAKS